MLQEDRLEVFLVYVHTTIKTIFWLGPHLGSTILSSHKPNTPQVHLKKAKSSSPWMKQHSVDSFKLSTVNGVIEPVLLLSEKRH